jgi:alkylation response protein AidB-like acyl-CoA dehydrogenase
MNRDEQVLSKVEEFLRSEVAPHAEEMDLETSALKAAVDGLCRLDLMALKRPLEYGGPNLSDAGMRHFQELIARYSGALAFLQTQHQGVVGMIAGGSNQLLKDEYLPKMGDGRKLIGVGFSQLRRPGPPIMRADPVEGGYQLNGHVPWITGWNFYPEFMIGASLPDGQALFAPVPLVSGSGVSIGEPMKLAAMTAANTVTADFQDFFVPEERVALIRPSGWIQNNDQINIAQQGSFALGCAQAGLDILKRNAEKRKLDFALQAYENLNRELTALRNATEEERGNISDETTQARLELRAWQIELAVRCAHAAVTSSSGAANSLANPAQRVYREALVFTVSAQTGPVMQATLNRIASASAR